MEKEYIRARYRKQFDKFKDETYELLLKDERFCFAKGLSIKDYDNMNEIIKSKVQERFDKDLNALVNLIVLSEGIENESSKEKINNLVNEILLDFKSEANYETLKHYRFSKLFLKWGLLALVLAIVIFAIIFASIIWTR